MGEHDHGQDDVAEPARPPLSAAQAREMTAGLREAMDDVRRSVAMLAARVRDAYAARVWAPLAYPSWEAYCDTEFSISRAQAYRLLDVARSLTAILGAVAAGTETSRTRDTDPPAAAALDYGLSQRALIAVSGRTEHVAELITRRLAALAHSGLQALDEPTVRAVVRQAVRDVRTACAARRSVGGSRARRAAPRRRQTRRQHVRDRRANARSGAGLPVRHRDGRRPGDGFPCQPGNGAAREARTSWQRRVPSGFRSARLQPDHVRLAGLVAALQVMDGEDLAGQVTPHLFEERGGSPGLSPPFTA